MIIYVLHNKYIGEREKYTIEFILDSLGYFYEWIDEQKKLSQSDTLLIYSPLDKNEDAGCRPTLHIPRIIDLSLIERMDIQWRERNILSKKIPLIGLPENHIKDAGSAGISFDLIANIYYHLARIEELNLSHPDQIDERLREFVLYGYDQFKIPAADILLNYFDNVLQETILSANPFFLKKCAYPNGEQFGAAITHDVDIIRAYHPLKKAALALLYRLKLRKSPSPLAMDKADEDNWGFNLILDFYRSTRSKGTFFFIAKYLENSHFRYRLKNPKIKNMVRRLAAEGHEIAFHPSRYAFEHPKRYLRELKRLKSISPSPVKGMRHHYLRCLYPDIWVKAEKLGLSYDAGLIYRRHSGFRAATSRPFIAFEHRAGRKLDLWEFPTAFFEGTIKNNDEIGSIIKTIARNHGLLNFIWHTNNFHENNEFRPLWKTIIAELEQYRYFSAPLTEHLNWQQERKALHITSAAASGNIFTIKISGEREIRPYSIRLISAKNNITLKTNGCFDADKTDSGFIIKNIGSQECGLEIIVT